MLRSYQIIVSTMLLTNTGIVRLPRCTAETSIVRDQHLSRAGGIGKDLDIQATSEYRTAIDAL